MLFQMNYFFVLGRFNPCSFIGLYMYLFISSDLVLCLLSIKLTFSQYSFSSELLKRKPYPKMASLILKLITYTHDTKPRFNT